MFPNLKLEIFRRMSHQNRLAKAVGIDETLLSKIIHGYRAPTAMQRKLLATYLEADEEWLFERFEATPLPGDHKQPPTHVEEEVGDDGGV
jgi:transcriptional regulator with XRE-family HTH domain